MASSLYDWEGNTSYVMCHCKGFLSVCTFSHFCRSDSLYHEISSHCNKNLNPLNIIVTTVYYIVVQCTQITDNDNHRTEDQKPPLVKNGKLQAAACLTCGVLCTLTVRPTTFIISTFWYVTNIVVGIYQNTQQL